MLILKTSTYFTIPAIFSKTKNLTMVVISDYTHKINHVLKISFFHSGLQISIMVRFQVFLDAHLKIFLLWRIVIIKNTIIWFCIIFYKAVTSCIISTSFHSESKTFLFATEHWKEKAFSPLKYFNEKRLFKFFGAVIASCLYHCHLQLRAWHSRYSRFISKSSKIFRSCL